MTKHFKKSDPEFLEQARVAQENTVNQPQIATTMADFGYDATVIAEGKAIYNVARAAYDSNKTEDDETKAAYRAFDLLREQLYDIHFAHRQKAKIVFRNDAITLSKLAVPGRLPQAYIPWLETVKKFYSTAIADVDIQTKLSRLKVTIEDLNAANTLIQQMEAARSDFYREEGESQDATDVKDAELDKLDEWMYEFYAVARIALEDKPQLLEAIGIKVKS